MTYHFKNYPFTPILGWSASRYENFDSCKRRYYYDYYGKHDPQADKILALKVVVSIPLFTGSLVHEIIEQMLRRLIKSQNDIDLERLKVFVFEKISKSLQQANFLEMIYGYCESIDQGQIYNKLMTSLTNLIRHEKFEWIKHQAASNGKEWIIEPPGFGETRISGLKAYCKVDFLIQTEESIHIIDWKTGSPNPSVHRKQLLAYTHWASNELAQKTKKIFASDVYLFPELSENQFLFEAEDIKGFEHQLALETHEMYAFCRDVEKNLPKGKSLFIKTTDLNTCKKCNYQALCFHQSEIPLN